MVSFKFYQQINSREDWGVLSGPGQAVKSRTGGGGGVREGERKRGRGENGGIGEPG